MAHQTAVIANPIKQSDSPVRLPRDKRTRMNPAIETAVATRTAAKSKRSCPRRSESNGTSRHGDAKTATIGEATASLLTLGGGREAVAYDSVRSRAFDMRCLVWKRVIRRNGLQSVSLPNS